MDKNKDPEHFINMIRNKEPFCFQRFNDGEIKGIMKGPGKAISRGDQVVDECLVEEMKKAITYEDLNYWKGIPCPKCFPKCSEFAYNFVRKDYPYKTFATLMVNDNWTQFPESVLESIDSKRPAWVVSGEDQNWSFLKNYKINFVRHLTVPVKNS